jgi:pyruvate dehydrogenase E1 component beta subunit
VVAHEEWKNAGIGAEVAARIYEQAFDSLDAPIERIGGADVPMPYAKNLERAAIPTDQDVIAAVKRALA